MSHKLKSMNDSLWAIGVVLLLFYAQFRSRDLPGEEQILPQLAAEPIQQETRQPEFQMERGGVTYTISPKFDYELHGLVVSFHDVTDHLIPDFHRWGWGDNLNEKDLCVLWGENLRENIYKKMAFRNGSWTCWFRTQDRKVWRQFNLHQVANNHLLENDESVRRAILKTGVGDQIRIKGQLVEYSHSGGFKRGTSVTRTDQGQGACETIFVREFEILKRANRPWSDLSENKAPVLSVVFLMWLFRARSRWKRSQAGRLE